MPSKKKTNAPLDLLAKQASIGAPSTLRELSHDLRTTGDAEQCAKFLVETAQTENVEEFKKTASQLFEFMGPHSWLMVLSLMAQAENTAQKSAKSMLGKLGGDKSADRFQPIREKAQALARERVPASGCWKSRREAGRAIEQDVKDFALDFSWSNFFFAGDNTLRTIDGYLKDMPDGDVLFSIKKRGPSN